MDSNGGRWSTVGRQGPQSGAAGPHEVGIRGGDGKVGKGPRKSRIGNRGIQGGVTSVGGQIIGVVSDAR